MICNIIHYITLKKKDNNLEVRTFWNLFTVEARKQSNSSNPPQSYIRRIPGQESLIERLTGLYLGDDGRDFPQGLSAHEERERFIPSSTGTVTINKLNISKPILHTHYTKYAWYYLCNNTDGCRCQEHAVCTEN